jgi:hypothetical protein
MHAAAGSSVIAGASDDARQQHAAEAGFPGGGVIALELADSG